MRTISKPNGGKASRHQRNSNTEPNMSSELLKINLQDPITNNLYEVLVTQSDAERLNTDAVFCNNVLDTVKKQLAQSSIPDETEATSKNVRNQESRPDCVTDATDGFKWSHAAILLLIEEYRLRIEKFTNDKLPQKKLWQQIGDILQKNGHSVTGLQCMSKFAGMKRTYKHIKDSNAKSGASARKWPYLSIMDGLLKDKPFMEPIATTSSTGKRVVGQEESNNNSSSSSNSGSSSSNELQNLNENFHRSPPRKQMKQGPTAQTVIDFIRENMATAEENRERRFQKLLEEKARIRQANAEQKERALNLLEQFLETCKNNKP